MNIVMTEQGKFVEIQGTAEGEPFTKDEMNNIIQIAEQGIAELIQIQKNVLK
jgi:ribonuclease PH